MICQNYNKILDFLSMKILLPEIYNIKVLNKKLEISNYKYAY